MVCIVQPYTPYIAAMPPNEPAPEYAGPLIHCKDVEAYRLAWEASRMRAADAEAMAADPAHRGNLDAALANIAVSPPPWERGGWQARSEPDWPPGERLEKMQDRLGLPSGIWAHNLQVTPKREKLPSMLKLKAARRKLAELADTVRDEAFEYWLNQYIVTAERPDEWTRSGLLYENYLKHAKEYGNNRTDKKLVKAELATETRFGKLMGSRFPEKRRRRDGWFYPVRLKRGA